MPPPDENAEFPEMVLLRTINPPAAAVPLKISPAPPTPEPDEKDLLPETVLFSKSRLPPWWKAMPPPLPVATLPLIAVS